MCSANFNKMEPLTVELEQTIKGFLERTILTKKSSDGVTQRITVVHILYNSYPIDFVRTKNPPNFLCWPLLADKLSMKYIQDKNVKLTHIIFNIDKRYKIMSHELTLVIEKHLASMYTLYPMVDFHCKTLSGMFFNPATVINQVKLLSTKLPSNLMYNFVYFGNSTDLQYNPFQLLAHYPRIFAPPYENNLNNTHMFADIKVTNEFDMTDFKWKTDDGWKFYELKEYRIPALLEFILIHANKCYSPVTTKPINIYELFDLPLTRASSGISPKSVSLIKTYLHIMLIDSKLQNYVDALIDEITSLCLTDILRIYILQLGGASGSECFGNPLYTIAVLLLYAVKQYMMLPNGRAQIYTPIIKAITANTTEDLIQECTKLVNNL